MSLHIVTFAPGGSSFEPINRWEATSGSEVETPAAFAPNADSDHANIVVVREYPAKHVAVLLFARTLALLGKLQLANGPASRSAGLKIGSNVAAFVSSKMR